MRQLISRYDAIQLIARAREAVCPSATLRELLIDYQADTVFNALRNAYAGASNGFLSQVCEAISGLKLEVTGEPEERLPCPCCHRRTLHELCNVTAGTGYHVCDYCNWEDDGTSSEQAHSSVNRGTMEEYRQRIAIEQNYYYREKWK